MLASFGIEGTDKKKRFTIRRAHVRFNTTAGRIKWTRVSRDRRGPAGTAKLTSTNQP